MTVSRFPSHVFRSAAQIGEAIWLRKFLVQRHGYPANDDAPLGAA